LLELGEEDGEHRDGAEDQDERDAPLVDAALPPRHAPPCHHALRFHVHFPPVWLGLRIAKESGVCMPSGTFVAILMGRSPSPPRRTRLTRTWKGRRPYWYWFAGWVESHASSHWSVSGSRYCTSKTVTSSQSTLTTPPCCGSRSTSRCSRRSRSYFSEWSGSRPMK